MPDPAPTTAPVTAVSRPGRRLGERLGRLLPKGLDGLGAAASSLPDWGGLADVVDRLAHGFVAAQPRCAELEINLLIWTGGHWRAADAMVRLGDGS